MAVDPIHDEIVVPNPFAQAILFFRADAGGDEAPLRIIQGPKTLLVGSLDVDNLEVSPANDEVYVAQRSADAIMAFDRRANGDVAPLRIIHGPKTQLRYPHRVQVNEAKDSLIVTSGQGILIFDRTANGDVAPKCVISGPNTGIPEGLGMETTISKAMSNPAGTKIIFSGGNVREWAVEQRGRQHQRSFAAIWNWGDCGDVPPLYRMDFSVEDFIPETQEVVANPQDSLVFHHLPEAY
ncbi:MAG: hypothetical protein HY315_08320 [Acidobacteria bacterium]|nr:hypothetical protein [Acidobacteriota bacterium]